MANVTIEEKLLAVRPMTEFLDGTNLSEADEDTLKRLRKAWEGYGVVGHKVMARMLLGQDAEKALRINGKE